MTKRKPKTAGVATVRQQFEAAKKRIARERDKLRGLQDDIEDLLDPTDRSVESLQEAIDALSEYL